MVPRGLVRSQFHDSFEYYQASWTPRLVEEFQRLHGYDLQKYAADLAGKGTRDADTTGRIAGDYRRTLAKLHLDYVRLIPEAVCTALLRQILHVVR